MLSASFDDKDSWFFFTWQNLKWCFIGQHSALGRVTVPLFDVIPCQVSICSEQEAVWDLTLTKMVDFMWNTGKKRTVK